jgi:hypothetical protein
MANTLCIFLDMPICVRTKKTYVRTDFDYVRDNIEWSPTKIYAPGEEGEGDRFNILLGEQGDVALWIRVERSKKRRTSKQLGEITCRIVCICIPSLVFTASLAVQEFNSCCCCSCCYAGDTLKLYPQDYLHQIFSSILQLH